MNVLGMKPVAIPSFPHLGVAAHGNIDTDDVFHPFERARELVRALLTNLS